MESQDIEESIGDKYILLEKKGKGGTSTVFLVKEPNTDKFYVGKILKEESNHFDNEVNILNKLKEINNPYIINIIDSGNEEIIRANKPNENKQYLILEYASKGELYNYIGCPEIGLQEKYSKRIFSKILEGIQACHKLLICHRDLKMQNILLDENFNPKICDFGFATFNNNSLTGVLGTPHYHPPEILSKEPYDGFKADIFSLGVSLLTLVSCKFGFIEAKPSDPFYSYIIAKKYDDYWNLVSSAITGISEEVKKLYFKMVSYIPEERPTIEEILNDDWFNEIKNLNNEQLDNLDKEIIEEFKQREIIVKNNTTIDTKTSSYSSSSYMDESRGGGENEKEYFDLSLKPQLGKTGFGMNNYIKINGDLKPVKFMNSLINIIIKEDNNCCIEESKKKLKFNVIFEEEEEEEVEIPKELKEELSKLGIKENDENENDEIFNKKDCIIQVKMLKSVHGGYILKFAKKEGEIEDYIKNLKKVIKLAKKIL